MAENQQSIGPPIKKPRLNADDDQECEAGTSSTNEPNQSKEILPEEHLRHLAQLLKGREWEVLATFLDFSLAGIEQRQSNVPMEDESGRESDIFAMLVTWKRTHGKVTSKHVHQLAEALKNCNRPDLAERLISGNFTQRYSLHWKEIRLCREELRKTYINRHGRIKKYPWSTRELLNIQNIFTNLLIHITLPHSNQPLKLPLESYQDMLSKTTEIGHPITRLLIQGKAGSGKTTLMDKIAYDWATTSEYSSPLGNVDLLFYLKMRWLESGTNIEDAIIRQLFAEDDDLQPTDVLTFISEIAPSVCIILDGYDEGDHGTLLEDATGNITKLLNNTILRNCRVVVTSRPTSMSDFDKLRSEYTTFEVSGFTEQNVDTYVHKFMDDDDVSRGLLQFLESNGMKSGVASVPLVTHLLCLYWIHRKGDNVPTTLFELYTEIQNFINEHYLARLEVSEKDIEVKLMELERLMVSLGNIAFKGLWPPLRQLVWTKAELLSNIDEKSVKVACDLGILTGDEGFIGKSQKSSGLRSSLRKLMCYEFFHKTIQEKCAGGYLSSLPHNGISSHLDNIRTVDEALDVQMVLLFACGTGVSAARNILKRLRELFLADLLPKVQQYYKGELDFEDMRKFQLFLDLCLQCNFESKTKCQLIDNLLEMFPEARMVFYGMTPQMAIAINYFLSHTTDPKCMTSLRIVGVPRRGRVLSVTETRDTLLDKEYTVLQNTMSKKSKSEIQELVRCYSKHEPTLQAIAEEGGNAKAIINMRLWQMFEKWQGGIAFVEPLVESLIHVHLKELNLRDVLLGKSSGKLFVRMKENCFSTLTTLNLRDTGLEEDDLIGFVDAIGQLKKLTDLDISYNRLGDTLVMLSEKLKDHGVFLRRLDVRNSDVSAKSTTHLWRNLPEISNNLEAVYTHGFTNHTDDSGMEFLAKHLNTARHLSTISISASMITNGEHISAFFTCLSKSAVWNMAIYEVCISPEEFIQLLTKGLRACGNLKWAVFGCSNRDEEINRVTVGTFDEFIDVLGSMESLTRFGLKDIPLEDECFLRLVTLCREKSYEQLMYSKRFLQDGCTIPDDAFLWLF